MLVRGALVKIAVFHNLPSGGAKRALYNNVKHLKSAGHQLDVYVPSTADENFLPLNGVVDFLRVYPVAPRLRDASYFRFVLPRVYAGIKQVEEHIAAEMNAASYDVVLSEQDQFTFTPFVLRYLETPVVYYCQQPSRDHEGALEAVVRTAFPPTPVPAYKRAWRSHLRKLGEQGSMVDAENALYAKYILANSFFSRETILRAYGLNSFVSYLGVDTDLFRPLSLPRENFVLSVGACLPYKGFDFVIRALSLIDKNRRPKLIIVSYHNDQRWEPHIRQMAARLGVELDIRSSIADTEVVALYNLARLFVFGAILEPFGLAPVEAMACGTPVVAVKEGGVRESVIHNVTGILTERDERAFAEAISELLDDDEKRERMGCGGVEAVRSFWTLKHSGERLESHLKRAVARSSPVERGAELFGGEGTRANA
jgi:glycosyltransferase involved in cell wall biosynthesis